MQSQRADKDIVGQPKRKRAGGFEKYEAITKDEYELFNSISDLKR